MNITLPLVILAPFRHLATFLAHALLPLIAHILYLLEGRSELMALMGPFEPWWATIADHLIRFLMQGLFLAAWYRFLFLGERASFFGVLIRPATLTFLSSYLVIFLLNLVFLWFSRIGQEALIPVAKGFNPAMAFDSTYLTAVGFLAIGFNYIAYVLTVRISLGLPRAANGQVVPLQAIWEAGSELIVPLVVSTALIYLLQLVIFGLVLTRLVTMAGLDPVAEETLAVCGETLFHYLFLAITAALVTRLTTHTTPTSP